MALKKHQLIRARGARWRVSDVQTNDDCTVVTVVGADAATFGTMRRFLLPFEDLETIVCSARPQRLPLRSWRRACRALVATAIAPGGLRSAAAARMDILPHQLEPALAVLHGKGCRVLLADDVGLGKTIQAGLIVSELLARRAVARVLILVPSGLTTQWSQELIERFAIEGFAADARALRRLAATLPMAMNPWSARPIAIASIDYVKRAEVLPAVSGCRWDVVVVDEAHTVAGESDRHAAIEPLAARASYVVLLSATPHNGDEEAYARLCRIGHIGGGDDGLLIFRRSREIVRTPDTRRVRIIPVRPTVHEQRMFAALERYLQALRDEHGASALAESVLSKRAFSSPWALATTVERRLTTLGGAERDAHQLTLPLDDGRGDLSVEDGAPAWPADLTLADGERERALLNALLAAARTAADEFESKLTVLSRFLRRADESALVFTEYRDTAAHLQAVLGRGLLLHGGLTDAERQQVLGEFARTPRELLIATDAAAQGVNLQRTCRLVVNLELPWNPMRLEQRIGRVDRIGQTRCVHAVHLVGDSTGELTLLARLERRLDRARAEIDAPDPLHTIYDRSSGLEARATPQALVEAARLATRRLLTHRRDSDFLLRLQSSPWWIARGRRSVRQQLRGSALHLYQAVVDDSLAATVATFVIGALVPEGSVHESSACELLRPYMDAWFGVLNAVEQSFWQCRLVREREIAHAAAPANFTFQAELFSRRAERAHDRSTSRAVDAHRSLERRLTEAEQSAVLVRPQLQQLLVLRP